MQSEFVISVIICTYNRAQVLGEALESYAAMALPAGVEVVVVDNRSSDGTPEVTRAFAATSGCDAQYVYESAPGLSHARNAGIRAARGEIVVFVDDDVYFEPGWASAMLDAFAQHPDADAVGGRIVPLFEAGRPKWLVDSLLPVYGQTNCGSTMRWLVYPEQPFGGNMAFRREVFEKVGLFDPRLGRDGKRLLSNEEIDFFFRFHQQGLRVLYEPNALLHHRIPADRTKPEWVCSRYYWQGVSDIVFRQITSPRSRWRLAFEGIGEWLREANTIRGGHISPRRIHWHIKGLSVEQRANRSERLGTCHQKLREALRLVPTKKQNS